MTKTKQKLKKTPRDNNNILPQINKLLKRNTKLKNLKFKIKKKKKFKAKTLPNLVLNSDFVWATSNSEY